MKEIGLIVIGHAGIGHSTLDLLLHRLGHRENFEVIVIQEYLPKNNRLPLDLLIHNLATKNDFGFITAQGDLPKNNNLPNEPLEIFEFKNYYEDIDFELKLAEIILTTDTEKSLASHMPCYEKIKLDRDYQFLSRHKELLRFNSRSVRPP
ncbi:MAG: hypothetical protein KBB86_02845 [Candidatus Pacebacteria bacterium]|nr:hypothetical protein [Candidatus Paceibacterota bacterium]